MAMDLGASLAGIASIDSLRVSPSYQICGNLELPASAKSLLVLALAHSQDNPELDWWGEKSAVEPQVIDG